jgi:hypothetical protein
VSLTVATDSRTLYTSRRLQFVRDAALEIVWAVVNDSPTCSTLNLFSRASSRTYDSNAIALQIRPINIVLEKSLSSNAQWQLTV